MNCRIEDESGRKVPSAISDGHLARMRESTGDNSEVRQAQKDAGMKQSRHIHTSLCGVITACGSSSLPLTFLDQLR